MDGDTAFGLGASKLRALAHERVREPQRSATLVKSRQRRGPSAPNKGIFGPWFAAVIVLLLAGAPAAATCVDSSTLAHSTVSITRYFADDDKKASTELLGIRGTAWFLSPTSLVTVEHVAAAMGLSDQNWKQVEALEGENKQTIDVRILRLAGSYSEKIAVLELRAAFPGARGLQTRIEPVAPEERVVSVAYPSSRLRFVGGRFVQYGDSDKLAGTALLEMFDGDNRLVLDHGASGAPVLDCEGRVVAVVSNIFTQTLQFPSRAIRISTAWGSPNVASVPIQVLQEFSQVQ
jgi:Trypsin-like peptidase domain